MRPGPHIYESMSTSSTARVDAGTSDGGQFATTGRTEPDVSLVPAPSPGHERLTVPEEAPARVREVAAAVADLLPPDWSGRVEEDPEQADGLFGGWSIELEQARKSAWASVEVSTYEGDLSVTAHLFDEDPGRNRRRLSTANVERALEPLRAHMTRWTSPHIYPS